jgi:hypothetical protein
MKSQPSISKNEYYTYAYLREDGTPYYIGKGKSRRIHNKLHPVGLPPMERRIFLKTNLTEEEAFKHEIYMIDVLGRKDIETGILRNTTCGGEGISGYKHTDETKAKISEAMSNPSEETRLKYSKAARSRRHTEEMKAYISEKCKNPSAEIRSKMSKSHTGVKFSEERKRIMSEAQKRRRLREATTNG